MLQATPYTPVFPPPLRTHGSPVSKSASCDSSINILNEDPHSQVNKKRYIDRLKERYIFLASLPQNELCPPSREASPGAENRIEALRLRMRKARDLGFPHNPELTLVCSGVKGGDWIGEPRCEEGQDEHQYVLPQTEEEWFRWERKKTAAREQRLAEKKAAEHRQKISRWTEEIEGAMPMELGRNGHSPQVSRRRLNASNALGFSIVQHDTAVRKEDRVTTSRYFAQEPPPTSSRRDDSEPVERKSSPMPPAPVLDPLPDFSDSFSIPNSPPSLPQLPPDIPFPDELPPSLSFARTNVMTSTPRQLDTHNPVFQLSSPVSPPRSSHALAASQSLPLLPAKRSCEGSDSSLNAAEPVIIEPTTPHTVKKARTIVEPITPASVPRQNCSQEQTPSPSPQRLPTLTALLANSRKTPRGRSRIADTPCRSAVAMPEFSPSQPTYSTFLPQLQSTQLRARSLPPSPDRSITSLQQISPQKSFPSSSIGMGFYQSQFDVENKVDEVAAFLNADVLDVGA